MSKQGGEEITRYYCINNKTGFGEGPLPTHIRLGDAIRIKEIEVTWPASHCKAQYQAALGQLNLLDEERCFSKSAAPAKNEITR